jgi:hypothetical protein
VNEFDAMDEVEAPDQWDDIVERSALAGRVEAEPRARSRRGLAGGAIAAAVLAVTLVAGLVALDRSGGDETVTLDTGPAPEATDSEATEPEVAEVDDAVPHLVCPTGELAAGSIPDDAEGPDAVGLDTMEPSSFERWTWEKAGLQVTFDVPSIPWPDSTWSGAESIEGADAWIAGEWSVVIGETGLATPCDSYGVNVVGGTQDENRAAALEVARALRWVEVPTVTEPEGVVDARTMRSYTMALAAEWTPVGSHRAELSVDRRFSESGVGGPARGGNNPALEAQWIWSGLLRVPGVPVDRDTVTTASVGETGEAFSGGGPYPLGLTDRAEIEPIPALIVGTMEE